MKKYLIAVTLMGSMVFSGCATNGIGMNPSGSSVKQSFEIGSVVDSHKVLIDKGSLASVGTGAVVGAVGGALLGSRSSGKNAVKGTLIGSAVGAVGGYVVGNMTGSNEVEAFEIEIESNRGKISKTYVEYDLPIGTILEYIERPDGTITNIDVKRAGKRVN